MTAKGLWEGLWGAVIFYLLIWNASCTCVHYKNSFTITRMLDINFKN